MPYGGDVVVARASLFLPLNAPPPPIPSLSCADFNLSAEMSYAYNATLSTDANMALLAADVAANSALSAGNKDFGATMMQNLDILWLLFGAYLVFFMQVHKTVLPCFLFPRNIFIFFLPASK
jgi:hypothetical protein